MLIAHLPAGYLLTKYIQKATGKRKYIWLGLIASILPDIDLFYFYLIDSKQTNHHDYFTHFPMFWGLMLFYSVGFVYLFLHKKKAYFFLCIFYSNIFLHMLLDSYAGYIKWFYPVFYVKTNLIEISANYDWWVWSFVLHWSFIAEVCIVTAATLFFRKNRLCPKKY